MSEVTWLFAILPLVLTLVDTQVPTGWRKVDVSSTEVVDLANWAVQKYDDTMDYTAKLSKILDGYAQVSSGKSYRLVVQMNLIRCVETRVESEEGAVVQPTMECTPVKTAICFFQLFTQPWMLLKELTHSFCPGYVDMKDEELLLENRGAWIPINPINREVARVAHKSVRLYNSSYRLQEVSEANFRLDILNGVEFNLSMEVKYFDCRGEFDVMTRNPCQQIMKCNFILKGQLWGYLRNIVAGVCGPWIVRDPSSYEVMEASRKALAIYKAGSTKVVKLVRVKEAISHLQDKRFILKLVIDECEEDDDVEMPLLCDFFIRRICKFQVFLRPSSTAYELQSSYCDDIQFDGW